jgi:hypothetical protein
VFAAANVVDQQPDRSIVVRHDHIGVAVVVDIAECSTTADFGGSQRGAGLSRDIDECSVAEMAEKLLGLLQ